MGRAVEVGKFFCNNFNEVFIDELYRKLVMFITASETRTYASEMINESKHKILNGNLKARLRMIYLYDIAKVTDGIVLSTDNFTELMLGFWTLHGDVGDFGMIQNLWKSEVYSITEYLANNEYKGTDGEKCLMDAVNCLATDGLGVSKSDLDQILPGWEARHVNTKTGYKEVYLILMKSLFGEDTESSPDDDVVIQRMIRTEYKRHNPYNIDRNTLVGITDSFNGCIVAPFTNEQVQNLNEYQKLGIVHPFTCCSPENIHECERSCGKGEGILIATNNGWVCPCGKYTQDWAHAFMANVSELKKRYNESEFGKLSPIK
jgi:NAD+ synthetase